MHSLVTDLDEWFKVENSGKEVSPLIVFVKLYTRNEATFCESRTLPKPQRPIRSAFTNRLSSPVSPTVCVTMSSARLFRA